MQHIKTSAIRGGLASLISQTICSALRLISLFVFARLLSPNDFGLIAMVTSMTGILGLLKDFGLSTATIQKGSITNEQLSALFWINMLVGFVLTCITLVAAPLISTFYLEPRILPVAAILSATFILNAAAIQHNALLQRQMRFVTIAIIDICSLTLSVSLGVALAVLGYGYWSLVGVTLFGVVFTGHRFGSQQLGSHFHPVGRMISSLFFVWVRL